MNGEFSEIELRKLDLNLLLVFSAIMRERSVGKAADRLFLGPSAASMALSRLRTAVGDQLFVKTAEGMEPTSRALALWEGLAPALASIETSIRAVRAFDPTTAERSVRFAAPDDLDIALLPRLMERLQKEAPGVRMIVRAADYRTLPARLDEGDADLALSATPNALDKRHCHRHLYEEPFAALYCPKQLGVTGDLNLQTFVAIPHLFRSLSGDFHGQIDDALAKIGETRRVSMALSNFSASPFLLKSSPCLINMPAVAARYFAEAFELEASALPIRIETFPVSIIWHARSDEDPFHVWFRELVAATCLDLSVETGLFHAKV
ncbi:LysR family transcriptional regulator [Thalassococcus sp. BH17M4-6]|uniref:LysR family transcriptional regulator n=1 Tax=Thalassococcus sp. BH17M4-6 TaxID=3413148 RepID=UPI003BE4B34A